MEEKTYRVAYGWTPTWVAYEERWQGFAQAYGYEAPRRWQVEALESLIASLSKPRMPWHEGMPRGVMVAAVMGSGKTLLIAELARSLVCESDQVIVVTTSSQLLVRQNAEDLRARMGPRAVGEYYANCKEWNRRVIVTTIQSAPTLAKILDESGRHCVLWIADEAHRTECQTILGPTLQALTPNLTVGLTATPYRSSQAEDLSLFSHLAYHYSIAQAIKDGVLCAFEVIPWVGPAKPVNDAVIEMLLDASPGDPRALGPGIVSADSIADAEEFAQILQDFGWNATAVHSRHSQSKRDAIMDRLREGHLDIVVHVNLLVEGANYPWLRWLCLRRSGCSRVRFLQEVGRVLRTCAGKTLALIFDPHGHFDTHALSLHAELAGTREETAQREPDLAQADPDQNGEGGGGGGDSSVALAKWVEEREYVPSYLRSLRQVLELHGMVSRFDAREGWRDKQPTRAQLALIRRRVHILHEVRDDIPERDLELLRCAYREIMIGSQDAGFVSDFIGVLVAAERSSTWPLRLVDEKKRPAKFTQATQDLVDSIGHTFEWEYFVGMSFVSVTPCDDQDALSDGLIRVCWCFVMRNWFCEDERVMHDDTPDHVIARVVRVIDPNRLSDKAYQRELLVDIGRDPSLHSIAEVYDWFAGPSHLLSQALQTKSGAESTR